MIRAAGVCISALAAGLLAGGCSLGGDDEPEPVRGAARQVADTISQLERFTRRRNFRAVCNELFTTDARRRAGGRDCPRLLAATGDDVRAPRIQLLSVRIEGERARARVRTSARGQAPVENEIELVRERGRYRISALAS